MTRVHVIPTPSRAPDPCVIASMFINTTMSSPLHHLQLLQNASVVLVLVDPSSFGAGYQQSCHWGIHQLSYSRIE
jgi:hypothetical protein